MEEEEFMAALDEAEKDKVEPDEEEEKDDMLNDDWLPDLDDTDVDDFSIDSKETIKVEDIVRQRVEDTELYKKGQKMCREGKVKPIPPVKIMWVEKTVSGTAWNNHYSQVPAYCYLGKVGNGVRVGFAILEGPMPLEHMELSYEDKQIVQDYRKANNIRPLVYEEKL